MKREEILLALKEAEEKTKGMVEEARKGSERSLAKARQDAALKMERARTNAADMREKLLAAKLMSMEEEARIISERGRLRAEKMKQASMENLERAIDIVMRAFERDLDV
jgi:vacuolar-type H+-ATPase subunit H